MTGVIVFLALFSWLNGAWACPFCDTGGIETALFIVSLLGCFIVGAAAVLTLYLRSGALKNSTALSDRVLKVEKEIENDGFKS